MKYRYRWMIAAAGLAVVVGCRQEEQQPKEHADPMQHAAAEGKLSAMPDDVKAAFFREHPNAAVTSAKIINTEAGTGLYQVTYVEFGNVHTVKYRMDGSVFQR